MTREGKVPPIEKADGYSGDSYHRFIKKQKRRSERRRAKQNPECAPSYGKYKGWEL